MKMDRRIYSDPIPLTYYQNISTVFIIGSYWSYSFRAATTSPPT